MHIYSADMSGSADKAVPDGRPGDMIQKIIAYSVMLIISAEEGSLYSRLHAAI